MAHHGVDILPVAKALNIRAGQRVSAPTQPLQEL
jgi:hypothetical protein